MPSSEIFEIRIKKSSDEVPLSKSCFFAKQKNLGKRINAILHTIAQEEGVEMEDMFFVIVRD